MEIESLSMDLAREHREIDAALAGFTDLPEDPHPLARAIRALRHHIYLEEEFVFPLLSEAEPGPTAPVFVMLREHAPIWATLDRLRELEGVADGPGGSALTRGQHLVGAGVEDFLLFEVMVQELAGQLPAAGQRLRTFLRSRELPEGWVCAKARPVTRNAAR